MRLARDSKGRFLKRRHHKKSHGSRRKHNAGRRRSHARGSRRRRSHGRSRRSNTLRLTYPRRVSSLPIHRDTHGRFRADKRSSGRKHNPPRRRRARKSNPGMVVDYVTDVLVIGVGAGVAGGLPMIADMIADKVAPGKLPSLSSGWPGVLASGVSTGAAWFVTRWIFGSRPAKKIAIGGGLYTLIEGVRATKDTISGSGKSGKLLPPGAKAPGASPGPSKGYFLTAEDVMNAGTAQKRLGLGTYLTPENVQNVGAATFEYGDETNW